MAVAVGGPADGWDTPVLVECRDRRIGKVEKAGGRGRKEKVVTSEIKVELQGVVVG